VEVFDPETGQVKKDDQGQLKIAVVVDWPIIAGLLGGEEYKNFFKWAKHFNNYHPEVTDEILRLNNYRVLRYQTATFDESVSSLRVFCEEERQFLQSYLWLRQLPEFFKPTELFAVMEDNNAKKQAEMKLQDFYIDKNKISFTDGSALQALIGYVKRLLQLYPGIKENTTIR